MKKISVISLLVLAGVFASATICQPALLGENKFLHGFVNHEFLSVFIVIVTVSFVSVTQIHLEYTRIERTFKIRVFADARREVNYGATILVTLLFLSIILVIVKPELNHSVTMQSLFHSIAVLFLVTAIFVMYDFVRTVYVIAAQEPIVDEKDGASEDDSSKEQ